jgi:hypothetical protein
MKPYIRPTVIAFLTSLLVILVFLVVSSVTKSEKTSFIATWICSSVIVTRLAFRFPETKWYTAAIVSVPLLLFLIIIYQGEFLLYYLRNTFFCLLIAYSGTAIGVWLSSERKHGLSKALKIWLLIIPVSLVIFLIAFSIKEDAKLNKPLIAVLDTIFLEDQKYRMRTTEIEKYNGDIKGLLKKMNQTDSINLSKVANIIDKYGWPGEDIIGRQGSSTLWAVIQHSSIENQLKYLPLMREAVNRGNARTTQLALLEDRILTNQGKEQIYGTQVRTDSLGKTEFFPIKDERNVNKRRFSVGLGPLQWYAKSIGFEYRFTKSKK